MTDLPAAAQPAPASGGRSPLSIEDEFHEAYRRFMLAHRDEALGEFRGMLADLERGFAKYGGHVLRLFFHPYVLGPELYRANVEASESIARVLDRVAGLYLTDPAVRAQFSFDPRVVELILDGPVPTRAAPVLRFDSFVSGGEIRFVEANTDGSSGMNDTNEVELQFLKGRLFDELSAQFTLEPMLMLDRLLACLLETYANDPPELSGPKPERPVIGIVDWKGVKTETEFFALKAHFERAGYETHIVDPREVTFDGRRLIGAGRPIDIVYKRVLTAELLARWSEVQPLIEGYRRRAYTQVGSYLGEVLFDKGVLAFLSNSDNAHHFSSEELERIRRHVPWTRRVKTGPVEYEGETWELAELLERRRERFVVKPVNQYGGAGVRIGKETRPDEWKDAVRWALEANFVAQEIVDIPSETLFMIETATLAPKKVSIGQFVFSGEFAGLYCRVSDATVINVSAGGATLPCFKVRKTGNAADSGANEL